MLIRVMLCFLGKVEGISRGIAVVLINFAQNSNCSKNFHFIIEVEVENKVVLSCKEVDRNLGLLSLVHPFLLAVIIPHFIALK